IRLALRNPYFVVVTAFLVVVFGGMSLWRIPADLLPLFKTPAVQIVTFYPGMPAEVMERDIMSRLERWTGQSVGIEHQEAKAMLGVCVVKDFFQEEISLDTAMSQVTSYAMSDMFYLPPGTIPPMVMPFDPTAMTPLCLLSISSETMNEKELYDIAYFQLRNRLQSISGVIAPAVYGGKLRRILAYVDRDSLRSRDLDPLDVVDAIGMWNTLIPTGNAKLGPIDYQLNANGMVQHVEELDDVPIAFRDGRPVYLRDVGSVEDSSQIQTNVVRINGRRQVYIPIYRQPGANSLAIVEGVQSTIDHIKARLIGEDGQPLPVNLNVVFDQSVSIRRAIKELELTALAGAGFAAVVIVVFLRSFLPSVAVLVTIPLAVLAAVAGLYFSGQSINSMTLGGIALSVGVMVDQAVVLMENILRHGRMGKAKLQAAWDGGREVATPVLVSTLTFVAVFLPAIFLSGIAKFLFVPLALAVTFGMISSYVLAMLLIPAFSARFVTAGGAVGGAANSRDSWAMRSYGSSVRWFVAHPYLTIILALALLAGSYWPYSRLGQELFPRLDQGQFTVFVRAPSGTRIEITEKEFVAEVERAIVEELSVSSDGLAKVVTAKTKSVGNATNRLSIPEKSEVQMVISNIGVLMDWPAAYTWNSGPMDAFVLVQLKENRSLSSMECVERLRSALPERVPGVEFAFDTSGMLTTALNFGLPSPINVRVEGTKSYDQAYEIAKHVRAELATIPGAVDVRIQQKLDYPQIEMKVDREKAAFWGLTQEDIVRNIVTATNSSINFKPAFWIDENNGNHYFIGVQYREEAIQDVETLESLLVNSPTHQVPVPLKDLLSEPLSITSAPAEITHLNITRMVDIFVNVANGYDVGTVSVAVDSKLQELRKLEVDGAFLIPEGFSVHQAGEFQSLKDSYESFGAGFALAAIVVYLILVVLFRSMREPLVILLSVPLGFVGVAWTLFAADTTLNIQSFMGIILMTGLVVEYGILLVDFANRRRSEGASIEDAIVEAAKVRLRPILMTSLTTLLALLPMAFFAGRGGGANAALARTILGGVAAATLLTLLIMPALYRLLARRRMNSPVELSEELSNEFDGAS
ncbi:MAG: efflux RND transporter permease subunit, partial [Planctomycetes bacterium]|nr:efflux RND transporter permease subunit [Planctomycetota bacterium]